MAPIYSSVDHFTFKPAPYDEGPAYLSVKIFKCWSKLAHAVTLAEDEEGQRWPLAQRIGYYDKPENNPQSAPVRGCEGE